MAMAIAAGTEADASAAAALHATEIGDGFLSYLGPRFLTRLYRRVVRHPASELLVARSDGEVRGMAAVTTDIGALYRAFLVHDGPIALASSLPRMARSWRRVYETVRYPARGAGDAGDLPRAEVLAVAVAPDARGQGMGRALTLAALATLDARGAGRAKVVAGADNVAAIALYRACGFRPERVTEVHRGARSTVLVR